MRWPWQREKNSKKREPSIPAGAIRRQLRYTGQVQAVGFRFTAQGFAKDRGLTGYVMNLPEGDVRLEVQGTPSQIEGFMADIEAQSTTERSWIRARLIQDDAMEPVAERGFAIRGLMM